MYVDVRNVKFIKMRKLTNQCLSPLFVFYFCYVLLMHCLLYEKENSRILAQVPRLSLNKLVSTAFELHYHCQTSIYGHHTNKAKCLHNRGIPPYYKSDDCIGTRANIIVCAETRA